eukprot:scaffold10284_cov61-Cyclotella_meneghiniana.AAC.7
MMANNSNVKTEEISSSVPSNHNSNSDEVTVSPNPITETSGKVKSDETTSSSSEVTSKPKVKVFRGAKGCVFVISALFFGSETSVNYGDGDRLIQAPTSEPVVPSSVPSSASTETTIVDPPSKKMKTEEPEYFLEIRWYKDCEHLTGPWNQNYGTDRGVREYYYSMFVDEIPKKTKFSNSHPFTQQYESLGDNHEHRLHLCLVNSKDTDRTVLVEIHVYYWNVAITLMHFHILSQDLANFSRQLWIAAGRNEDDYCDMSVEFGESKYSHITVKSLITKAMGIKNKSDMLYIDKIEMYAGATTKDSLRILEMIFQTCKSASVIVYETDLKKLGITGEKARTIAISAVLLGPTRNFEMGAGEGEGTTDTLKDRG